MLWSVEFIYKKTTNEDMRVFLSFYLFLSISIYVFLYELIEQKKMSGVEHTHRIGGQHVILFFVNDVIIFRKWYSKKRETHQFRKME